MLNLVCTARVLNNRQHH